MVTSAGTETVCNTRPVRASSSANVCGVDALAALAEARIAPAATTIAAACLRFTSAPRTWIGQFAANPIAPSQNTNERHDNPPLRAENARHNDEVNTVTSESRPGWLLDELRSAGRENLDVDHVQRYDAKEDAGARDEVLLLKNWGLTATSHVIDVGPGTGQFTVAVAAECQRVIAVDVSPVMLAVLQAKLTAAGINNVEIARAGFLSYEHTGRPADVVYSRYALHHLPDFWKTIALHRVHRMLRPGGILRLCDIVYSFDPAQAHERIEAWCATGGSSDDQWSRAELEEHVRDEHSTFTWLLEPMLRRAGFVIADASYSPDGMLATYIARAT